MSDTPQVRKQNISVEKSRMPNTYSRYCLTNNIITIPCFCQKKCMIFCLQPGWFLCLVNVLTKQEKHSVCRDPFAYSADFKYFGFWHSSVTRLGIIWPL